MMCNRNVLLQKEGTYIALCHNLISQEPNIKYLPVQYSIQACLTSVRIAGVFPKTTLIILKCRGKGVRWISIVKEYFFLQLGNSWSVISSLASCLQLRVLHNTWYPGQSMPPDGGGSKLTWLQLLRLII